MSPDAEQIRREECREGCLRFLATRNLLAHSCDAVRRGVNREGADFDFTEVLSALNFLVGKEFASVSPAALGASKAYQVTADGTLHYERSGR